MQEKDKSWNLIDNVDEYPLLLGDLGAIFIACQLQGLSDVLITPDFWNQGGFFQPIVYSTDTGEVLQPYLPWSNGIVLPVSVGLAPRSKMGDINLAMVMMGP